MRNFATTSKINGVNAGQAVNLPAGSHWHNSHKRPTLLLIKAYDEDN